MFKYLFFVTFAVCLWFICADWGVSKVSADNIQSQLEYLKKISLVNWAATKEIERKLAPVPEQKKWRR